MKRASSYLLLLLSSLCLATPCFAVFNFTVKVNHASEDYNTITLAEAALDNAGSLTDSTVKCGNWDAQSGTIADATAVTWDAGVSTGTLIHMTDDGSSGTYLVDVTAGTIDDNDIISDGTNTITVNGTTDSCIVEIDLYDDQGDLDDSFTVDGFTANSTNYVLITAPSGERHAGVATGAGAEIASTAAAAVVALSDTNTIFEWIIVKASFSSVSNFNFINMNQDGTIVRNTISHDSSNSGAGAINRAILCNNFDCEIQNNIIYTMAETNDCINCNNSAGDVCNVYNNTAWDCGSAEGIDEAGVNGTTVFKNNLIISDSTTDIDNADTVATNGSGDTTGSTGLTGLVATTEFTSTTGGSEDLHLKAGAVSINAGTDLGTTNQVDIDIDGVARTGTWDISADETVSTARRIMLVN